MNLAAEHVAARDRLGPRQAKAKVHAMGWDELVSIIAVETRDRTVVD